MGKLETLKALQRAGLPVPPLVGIPAGDAFDLVAVRQELGCGPEATYAVRSSFDGEDGGERSYAGQFLTRLGVSEVGLAAAVAEVGASYDRRIAYGDGALDGSGMVIVQPMVNAAVAGVAFTSEPAGGFVGETVISFGVGLGEGVVSGSVETATWHIAASGDAWVTGDHEVAKSLDIEMARTIGHLASRCRDVIGAEADMEFAVDHEGHAWVLQARPITVIAGMPTAEALASTSLLDNSNIVESYPGVVLPLTQGFAMDLYQRIFSAAVTRLSGDASYVKQLEPCLSTLVQFSDWHAYYHLESWYALLSFLPMSDRIKRAWRASLGVSDDAGSNPKPPVKVGPAVRAKVVQRFLWNMARLSSLMDEACGVAERIIVEGWKRLGCARSFDEAWDVYESLRDEVMPWWDVTLLNDIDAFVLTALAGEADRIGKNGTDRQVDSMRPLIAFDRLVAVASERGMDSADYEQAKASFVSEHGDRCIGELKLETRTWRSDPDLLDAAVAARVAGRSDGADSLLDASRVVDISARRRRHGVRSAVFSSKARAAAALRERSRLLRTRMFGLSRAVFLACGAFLVEAGQLQDAHDIFYLELAEAREAAAEVGEPDGKWVRLVESRREVERALDEMPTPTRLEVVDGHGTIHSDVSAIGGGVPATSAHAGDLLRGVGTSPGNAVASVIVVDGRDLSVDTKGKVIVTVSTDPGWAFLIMGSAGIVAERGSLLSHTSIISRELGIPAVVAVKGATAALADGDVVEIDGTTGTVLVVSKADDPAGGVDGSDA